MYPLTIAQKCHKTSHEILGKIREVIHRYIYIHNKNVLYFRIVIVNQKHKI